MVAKNPPAADLNNLNRGAWTAEEDEKLSLYIRTHGQTRWRLVPSKAGINRCGRSCRLRWLNYLRPNIKRGNISAQEEDLIVRLHKLLGNRWFLIAGRLPGRTDNEIKNYWNTRLSKKLKLEQHRPAETLNNIRDSSAEPEKSNASTKKPISTAIETPRIPSDKMMSAAGDPELKVETLLSGPGTHSKFPVRSMGKVKPVEDAIKERAKTCDVGGDENTEPQAYKDLGFCLDQGAENPLGSQWLAEELGGSEYWETLMRNYTCIWRDDQVNPELKTSHRKK